MFFQHRRRSVEIAPGRVAQRQTRRLAVQMRDGRCVSGARRSIENSRANGATAATRVEFQRGEVSQERRLRL